MVAPVEQSSSRVRVRCLSAIALLFGPSQGGAGFFTEEPPLLLFASGFEEDVRIAPGTWGDPSRNLHHLAGRDRTTGFDWLEDLRGSGALTDAHFHYVIRPDVAAEDFVTTAIRTMPGRHGQPTRVLHLDVKGDDPLLPATTRNEFNLFPAPRWRQAYARYWMHLHPDLPARASDDTWVMIMEWKEPRDPAVRTGGTNNWRANVTLRGVEDGRLAWHFQRQTVQPERITEQLIGNRSVPVVAGRWFLVEVFWRWGHEGRVWFAVDGQTLFDEYGRFEHPTRPLGLKWWAPFKNYRGPGWFEDEPGGVREVWFAYDDFELWSDFPSDHPEREAKPLVLAHFDDQPDTLPGEAPPGWWFEGAAGGAQVQVRSGRLHVDAAGAVGQAGTVWLAEPLAGDLVVTFDVHVVRAIEAVNNMNLFLDFRAADGASLKDGARLRADGGYRHYHGGNLEGLIVTFLTDEERSDLARVRVRAVPPFGRPLAEFRGGVAESGRTFRIQVVRRGPRLTYAIDGEIVASVDLPLERADGTPGHLGFRTWQTHVWWDNLVIRRP